MFAIGFYRTFGTQFFGGNCRFEPSCSSYCLEAFKRHNFLFALNLSLKRLGKCHPFGSFGWDPVPQPETNGNCCKHQKKHKEKWTARVFSDIKSSELGVDNGK